MFYLFKITKYNQFQFNINATLAKCFPFFSIDILTFETKSWSMADWIKSSMEVAFFFHSTFICFVHWFHTFLPTYLPSPQTRATATATASLRFFFSLLPATFEQMLRTHWRVWMVEKLLFWGSESLHGKLRDPRGCF